MSPAQQLAIRSTPASFQARGSAVRARRPVTVQAAKKAAAGSGKQRLSQTGYIVDNSERGNIFAIEPRQLYTSSPTADRAARQGLGGTQGLAVLAGALGIVALVTLVGAAQPPDTLQGVAAGAGNLDSLSALASRISTSL